MKQEILEKLKKLTMEFEEIVEKEEKATEEGRSDFIKRKFHLPDIDNKKKIVNDLDIDAMESAVTLTDQDMEYIRDNADDDSGMLIKESTLLHLIKKYSELAICRYIEISEDG